MRCSLTVREATTAPPCFSTICWVLGGKGTVSAKGAVVIGVVLSPKSNETSKQWLASFVLPASYSSRQ